MNFVIFATLLMKKIRMKLDFVMQMIEIRQKIR